MDPSRDVRVDTRLKLALESGSLPKELLICGPAGTGKTFGVLSVLHTLCRDYRDLRVLIVRQTRASLTESVLATFEREVLPRDGCRRVARGPLRRTRQSYRYPRGSEIVLGGLDRPDRVLSTAWDIVYVNEAIETAEEAWDTLGTRTDRPGGAPWAGYLIGDTNPGDPSHWLKTRCDDGRTALWDTSHRANPELFDRVTGEWTEAGRRYLARLDRLRGSRRKRLLDGLWAAGEGLWFEAFSADLHLSTLADYEPSLPVVVAVDSGVYTGAVAFQIRPQPKGPRLVTVFADWLFEGVSAHSAASQILQDLGGRKAGLKVWTDPAGGARNPIGPTVMAEYERAGLKAQPWPGGSVADGLALVEALLSPHDDDRPRLLIHPRCTRLATAFANYRRDKKAGQWLDAPEDPQHPHEDLIDSLRGGLRAEFPSGLAIPPVRFRTPAKHLGY